MKKPETANFSGQNFRGVYVRKRQELIISTFRLKFCYFFVLLRISERTTRNYQLFVLQKYKIRWEREKIMIDNLELSLLLVMRRNFCDGDGESP